MQGSGVTGYAAGFASVWLCALVACGGETSAGGATGAQPFGPVPGVRAPAPPTAGAGAEDPGGIPTPPATPPPPPPPPITFTPAGGTYVEPFALSLTARTAASTIHFTLDGSVPTAASAVYEAPLQVEGTVLVRAMATMATMATMASDGSATTPVVDVLYVQVTGDAVDFSSDLPLVVVHMLGRDEPGIDDHEYNPAGMLVLTPQGARTPLVATAQTDVRVGIKVRGRSTREEPKHSFSVETWGLTDGVDQDAALLDMPAHSDWALYAPYNWDRALIRNALVYALSNDMGRYAARTRFVELFLVEGEGALDSDDYMGVFVLMERIKRDAQRVPVEKLGADQLVEPAISGGYIFKVDDVGPGERGFDTEIGRLAHVYPREEVVAPEQADALSGYVNDMVSAARSDDGKLPGGGTHYSGLIDVGSFIDHHVLNTLTKNPDALRLSGYYHKYRNGPVHAGPVWDFDRTLGSYDGRDEDPQGWSADGDGTELFEYSFWGDLFRHEEFKRDYVTRFGALLDEQLAVERIHARIDVMAAELREASVRNGERWPDGAPRGGQLDNEIDDLKQWVSQRVAWIRQNLGAL